MAARVANDSPERLLSAIDQLDTARKPLEAKRATLEQESRALAATVEAKKTEKPSVRRDLELNQAQAAARASSDALSAIADEIHRNRRTQLELRTRLIQRIDELLRGTVPEARRLELGRLRATQAALMASPEAPLGVSAKTTQIDPLDGPRELKEKADFLRDSEDKLRREMQRLSSRIDSVERKRRLRERASSVDEDLFGESVSNRHVASAYGAASLQTHTSETKASAAADSRTSPTGGTTAGAPPQNALGEGGGASSPGPAVPSPPPASATAIATPASVLRNIVDPATLEELKRADLGDDLERQIRALKRAQGELDSLAKELDRRARVLSDRAEELKHKK